LALRPVSSTVERAEGVVITMPRYFFDVDDEGAAPDHEGSDLPDLEMAREYASGLVDTIRQGPTRGRAEEARRVLIRNESGELIETISSLPK
jgi:hypothetical protein